VNSKIFEFIFYFSMKFEFEMRFSLNSREFEDS
jgi:hypothetical protein